MAPFSFPVINPCLLQSSTVGTPAQLLIVSGNGQSDTAGTALPQPLVVEVRDSVGNVLPAVSVTWSTLDGSIAPPSGTTDAAGQAQATWTLSTNRITQTATANVAGLTPAVFTATAIFPNPSILLALVGTDRVRVGSSATLQITLTAPAGVNGVFVSVVSSNPAVLEVDTTTGGGAFIHADGTTGQVVVTGLAGGDMFFIPFTEEARKALIAKYPFFMEAKVPANTYKGQTEEFPCLNVGNMQLITGKKTDEDLVYQVTKTIYENREAFVQKHPAGRSINANNVVRNVGTEFHPGAIRYYKEMGLLGKSDGLFGHYRLHTNHNG